jgi:hypothetical protein
MLLIERLFEMHSFGDVNMQKEIRDQDSENRRGVSKSGWVN